MSTTTVIASFIGGILPTVIWLEFWLREEAHQEPRRLIVGTFILGMISILVAGILEESVSRLILEYTTLSFLLWAIIEEVLKYGCAYFAALRSRFCHEAVDPTIYMITAALGFAAAENILFLHDALTDGGIGSGLATIMYRSIGATLLHIIASSLVGILIGFAFYKSTSMKRMATAVGLFLAVALHTAFNRLIIIGEQHVLGVFAGVWVGLIIVILILEKIKSTKRIKSAS